MRPPREFKGSYKDLNVEALSRKHEKKKKGVKKGVRRKRFNHFL